MAEGLVGLGLGAYCVGLHFHRFNHLRDLPAPTCWRNVKASAQARSLDTEAGSTGLISILNRFARGSLQYLVLQIISTDSTGLL